MLAPQLLNGGEKEEEISPINVLSNGFVSL